MSLKLIFIKLAVLAVFLSGCAQQLANYDYNPGFNYSGLQSYVMQQSDKQTYQSLDGARIEEAIKQQLNGRYQLAAAEDQADFSVLYYVLAEQAIDNSGVSVGFGFGVSRNVGVGGSTSSTPRTHTEGKLVLEVVDRHSDQLVWTAKATRNLTDRMKPEQRAALINDLAQEMLANFPPQ